MRVLHLVKTSVGARWALRQMSELVRLGLEVHVALPAGGPLVEEYVAAGINVHAAQFDLPLRRPWACRTLFTQLRDLVSQIKPSIIHSHFVGTTLTMRLALGKSHPIPRVFQVPGPLHLEHPFFRKAELLTAGSVDSWIGSCRWTCRRYAQSGIPRDRIFLSYYGLDPDRFKAGKKGKLRSELGVSSTSRLLGMVAFMYAPRKYLGQTRGIKGHEDLIDAVSLCLKERRDIFCVFIGGAWNGAAAYEQRVRAYAEQRLGKRAVFLGTRNDVAELYPDLDVVVHPSHSENVGGAAESLLLAVPTIASDVGGLPDLVRPNETGWLVPPRSPGLLAGTILEALLDPRRARQMAVQGQKLARELFDVRNTALQINEVYRALLSNRGGTVLRQQSFEPRRASAQ